jgi:outer membrane cobalamin receptor
MSRWIQSVLLLLFLTAPALAQQDKGAITGRVTDKRNGHALPFASVSIPSAKRGGLTDSEGQFTLSGLPVGTYEVRVQFLGYRPDGRAGVVVTAGKPAVVNFSLEEIVVREEKAIEVNAERRLVEVRQGATVRSVNANEIRNLPVQTISDVLQQQAGINTENDQIHVRGGRSDETVFVVNGVANRDLVTGQSTAGQLNARSVSEVNVATGAYDVRFGNALSGVVDVTLKEGSDKPSFGLTMTSGTYGLRSFQGLVSGPDPALGRVLHWIGLRGSFSSIVDVSGNLFESRYLQGDSDGWLAGMFENTFKPASHSRLISGYEDSFFGKKFHYGNFFTPARDNKWAARYGITWKPNVHDKVTANFSKRIAIDQGFSRTFINASGDLGDPAFPWQWAKNIEHAPTIFEDNVQSSIEWRRTLSTTGFTSLQLSRYFFAQRQDVLGKWWWQYEQPDDRGAFGPDDPRGSDYFIETGDDDTWQDRRSTSYGIKYNLTQRIRRHDIEFGIDHDFQTVQYVTIQKPWNYDPSGLGDTHDLWKVHPWVGDFYVRDRLEYEGFTANVGLRGEYWFVGREAETAIADTSNANITPETRTKFYSESHQFFGRRYKLRLSPRVIVAHPITENSSFFFNYGQFVQNPSYRYVYSKLNSTSSESFPLLGNPNLNPQVSINYEVGAKHQFRNQGAVNATFFVKDVYDYPTATTFKRSQGASLVDIFVYLNGHFARSKGFELQFERRRKKFWSGKVTYTYQQTKGKSSDPNEQRVVLSSGGDASETRLSEAFVSWNRPHKLAVNFDARFEQEAPERFPWLKHSGINIYVQGQSGRSYTPLYVGADGVVSSQSATPYSGNAPFQMTTDLRLNHWFKMGRQRLDISLAGTNIFDNRLINRVDPVTGKGRVWGVGSYDPALFPRINDYTRISQVDDPSNYGMGAVYRLSLDYDF